MKETFFFAVSFVYIIFAIKRYLNDELTYCHFCPDGCC